MTAPHTPMRRSAETRLRARAGQNGHGPGAGRTAADSERLLHELQVHQIELEMQNEELREARNELEAGLDKYSELYDFAPVGYLTLDREGAISEANLTAASLLGVPRAPLVKQRLGVFVAPADRANFHAFLEQTFANKTRRECEVRLQVKGKSAVDVQLKANLFASGLACRVAIVDITARKLAQADAAQLAALVTSSSDAIIGRDLSGIVTSWNAGAERLFGYDAGEMVGGSISRLVPANLLGEEAEMIRRIQDGNYEAHRETVRVTKDGRHLEMSVTNSPIRQADGRIIGISKVARDITEQRRAADRLVVSEVRYRRLFEASKDGILILNPQTRKITDANPFIVKVLGYTREQLVGKELWQIGLLKDEAASQEAFRELKKNAFIRYEDLPLETRGGKRREVEFVSNLYNEGGAQVIQCNIRDITERKRAEDALRRNEALFAALIDQAPMGVYVVDAGFRMAQINPKALPQFLKIRPLIGRNFGEIVNLLWPRPAATSILALFRHTMRTGEAYQSPEFRGIRRDTGKERVYDFQIQRITLPNGEHGAVCFFDDITESKQAELALQASEERYRTLFSSIDEGYCVVEVIYDRRRKPVDYRYVEVNPAFTKLTGLVKPVGKTMRELLPGNEDHWINIYNNVVLTGKAVRFVNEAKGMGDRWFDVYACPVGGPGSPKVAIIFNDITARRKSDAALRVAREALTQHAKMLEKTVAARTVELIATNQRLTLSLKTTRQGEEQNRVLLVESQGMQAKLRLLTHQILTAQEEERKKISRELHDDVVQTLVGINVELATLVHGNSTGVRQLKDKIAHTQRLVASSVDAVHRFARELRPSVLDDLGLIPALHAFCSGLASRKKIKIKLTAIRGVEALTGDKRTVLFRVAQEALHNVARHARATRVQVSISKIRDAVCMVISDNGKSFPVSKVLAAKNPKRLGLVGMRERVEMVGGNFTIESLSGQGTTVRAEIPLHP